MTTIFMDPRRFHHSAEIRQGERLAMRIPELPARRTNPDQLEK